MLAGKTYSFWAAIVFLLLLCYFTLFWQLDAAIMREWDEARNSVHAINMAADGNYLVRIYDGKPDMWETKPPLFVWLQVLCIKIIGPYVLAFRLPSAMAALATVGVITRFLWQQTKSLLPGIGAAFVMLTAYGYTLDHCARTADHDALLIFFETALCISFYKYLHGNVAVKNKYLLYCFICFTLAALTKSIAVFMVFPGLVLYSLYQLKIVDILKQPRFYLYTCISLGIVFLYYYLHELKTPGYLQAVWENELFPRYFNSAKTYSYNTIKGPFHYIEPLVYQSYLPIAVPAFVIAVIYKNTRRIALYYTVLAVVFYIVATNGTFNSWYILPVVPMLAIVAGMGIYATYVYILQYAIKFAKPKFVNAMLLVLCAVLIYEPTRLQLAKEQRFVNSYNIDYSYGNLFGILKKEHPEITSFDIYINHHSQSVYFYYELYSKLLSYRLGFIKSQAELKAGNIVMCAEPVLKEQINQLYKPIPIAAFGDCVLYKLYNR